MYLCDNFVGGVTTKPKKAKKESKILAAFIYENMVMVNVEEPYGDAEINFRKYGDGEVGMQRPFV